MPHFLNTSLLRLVLVAFLALNVSACATVPEDPEDRAIYEETNDPLEPFNRWMLSGNMFLDQLLFRPIAMIYRGVVPEFVRNRVHNVLVNLNEPINLFNNVLQARFDDAATTVGRFAVNTTAGGLGLFDVATDMGMPLEHADFGQTLYSWGLERSPYLVLPLIGPTTVRDAGGRVADAFMDPWPYALRAECGDCAHSYTYAVWPARFLDARTANLDAVNDLEKNSIDFYAALRSAWTQYRAQQLKGGAPSSL